MERPSPYPPQPPAPRSQAAGGLAVAAAQGRFALQVCQECDQVQYPPRDVCRACLSTALVWRDVPADGMVLATTTIRLAANPYFAKLTPWRVGIIRMDCGPSVIAHLHGECQADNRVRLTLKIDKAGAGVMVALPVLPSPEHLSDRQLREFVSNLNDRSILVAGPHHPSLVAVARALLDAGAARIVCALPDAAALGRRDSTLIAAGMKLCLLDGIAADPASIDAGVFLVETVDQLEKADAFREILRPHQRRVLTVILGTGAGAREMIGPTVLAGLQDGVEQIIQPDAPNILQPSKRWPGLWVHETEK